MTEPKFMTPAHRRAYLTHIRTGRRTTGSNHRAGMRENQKSLTGVILWDFPS